MRRALSAARFISTAALALALPPASAASAALAVSASSPSSSRGFSVSPAMSAPKVEKSDEEWKAVLTPAQFKILRQKGTEPAYTGQYDKFYPRQGVFTCAGCDAPLYTASSKFDSGCGWPAFFEGIPGAISQHEDNSFGMRRIEITCTACGGHLGHVFRNEGFPTPTNERHCVNSISIKFNDPVPKA